MKREEDEETLPDLAPEELETVSGGHGWHSFPRTPKVPAHGPNHPRQGGHAN